MERLNRDAEVLVRHFGLRYRAVEADRANATSRYGICYSDGTIRIRLRHATTGKPLKYSSLINTLCHELAHLRHFNHGPRFRDFYLRILAFARQAEIYQPSRRAAGPSPRPQPLTPPVDRTTPARLRETVRTPAAEAPPRTRQPARRPEPDAAPTRTEAPRVVQLDLFG